MRIWFVIQQQQHQKDLVPLCMWRFFRENCIFLSGVVHFNLPLCENATTLPYTQSIIWIGLGFEFSCHGQCLILIEISNMLKR